MTNEEYAEWKHYDLTARRFAEYEKKIEQFKEQWEVGNLTTEKESDYHRGIIRGLRMAMEAVDEE